MLRWRATTVQSSVPNFSAILRSTTSSLAGRMFVREEKEAKSSGSEDRKSWVMRNEILASHQIAGFCYIRACVQRNPVLGRGFQRRCGRKASGDFQHCQQHDSKAIITISSTTTFAGIYDVPRMHTKSGVHLEPQNEISPFSTVREGVSMVS